MSENPIKFTAGLTVAIQFIAEIENVENTENLRIQVTCPILRVSLDRRI